MQCEYGWCDICTSFTDLCNWWLHQSYQLCWRMYQQHDSNWWAFIHSQTYIYQSECLILRILRNLQRITTTCVVRNCQVQVKRECLCRSQSQSSFSLCVPNPRLYQVFVRLHKTHPCYITTTPNTIFAAECWSSFQLLGLPTFEKHCQRHNGPEVEFYLLK